MGNGCICANYDDEHKDLVSIVPEKLSPLSAQIRRLNHTRNTIARSISDGDTIKYETMIPTVEHFVPSTFPVKCYISMTDIQRCMASWNSIKNITTKRSNNLTRLTLFVDTFYKNLSEKKVTIFDDLGYVIKAKILANVLHFMLNIVDASELKLRNIASVHYHMNIPTWQFSAYMETILKTLAEVLKYEFNYKLEQSWIKLCNFALRKFLTGYVTQEKVVDLEYFVA